MKANIVKIGNSQGIRLPKVLLEQCGFNEGTPVEVFAKNHQLIIKSSDSPRAGWGKALQKMAKNGDDELMDIANIENSWDNEEWEW